jgi:tetratricopeptide (TPR) repeat protein
MMETVHRRWRSRAWLNRGLVAAIVGVLAVSAPLLARAQTLADDANVCPPNNTDPNNIRDYRARDSSSTQKWSIDDNMTNHTAPAIERIRVGEYSRRVLADLNFTLDHWPNHLLALQALVKYDLAGGKQYEFMSAQCYFARARQFAPDDVGVILMEAYYHWKKNDTAGAIALYEAALKIDPDSADAHYNLGLLYVQQANYAKASEQARAAYSAGYPLPGLRNKLAAAGYSEQRGNVAGATDPTPMPTPATSQ